jgi:hypothetical protein
MRVMREKRRTDIKVKIKIILLNPANDMDFRAAIQP